MKKELQEEIVNDLLNNFQSITGHKLEEVVDFSNESDFIPSMIMKTFKELDLYVAKKYTVDLRQNEELLSELDDKILIKVYNTKGKNVNVLA